MRENVHKTTRCGSNRDHVVGSSVDGRDMHVNCEYDARPPL